MTKKKIDPKGDQVEEIKAYEITPEHLTVQRQAQYLCGAYDAVVQRYVGALVAAGLPLAAAGPLVEKEIAVMNASLARIAQESAS